MNPTANFPQRAFAIFGAVAMTVGLMTASFAYSPQAHTLVKTGGQTSTQVMA